MNVRLKPLITAEEFERMSSADGYELIDGELREKSMGAESSWVQTHIGYLTDTVTLTQVRSFLTA